MIGNISRYVWLQWNVYIIEATYILTIECLQRMCCGWIPHRISDIGIIPAHTILDESCCITLWWRHQMEAFSALLAICAGNSPVPGEFPAQRPVTRSFDVYFDLHLNKRLNEQSWGWWFETLSCPLWRHCNEKQRRQLTFLWKGKLEFCTLRSETLIISGQFSVIRLTSRWWSIMNRSTLMNNGFNKAVYLMSSWYGSTVLCPSVRGMKENSSTGPSCGKSTGDVSAQWPIKHNGPWALKISLLQTIVWPIKWDVITLMWCHPNVVIF